MSHLQSAYIKKKRKKRITLTTNHNSELLGAHLISCCLHQISVFPLTEWTALINSRNNQLWMQSDPWGDYWLLSSDLHWSQQPVTPGRLSTHGSQSNCRHEDSSLNVSAYIAFKREHALYVNIRMHTCTDANCNTRAAVQRHTRVDPQALTTPNMRVEWI